MTNEAETLALAEKYEGLIRTHEDMATNVPRIADYRLIVQALRAAARPAPDAGLVEREAFESWVKASNQFTDWSRAPDWSSLKGVYLKPRVEFAWQVWRAALLSTRAVAGEPVAITDAMVEAAARTRCKRDGGDPDHPMHYEQSNADGIKMLRTEIGAEYLGRKRDDGSIVKQWPTTPYWRWKYERSARLDLEAAFAARPAPSGRDPATIEALIAIRQVSELDDALLAEASAKITARMAEIHQHADAALDALHHS